MSQLTSQATRHFSWKRLCAVVFLLLPVVASVVYMWAMWDPTKNLRSVDLAVVNEDAGATRNGEFERYGDKVVKGLLARDYLAFREVDANEAKKGLDSGKYLFTVTIPESFSANVNTLLAEKPTNPEITISYNDFNGTNGSVLTGGLVPKIQQAVSASISESYAKKLLNGVNNLGGGLTRAADGSAKLDEGAGKLQAGLAKGMSGAQQLNGGAHQLSDGTSQLVDGSSQLAAGAGRLAQGTARLGDGAQQIDAGVGKLTDTLIPVLTTAQNAAPQLQQAADALRAIGAVEQANKVQELATKFDANNPDNQVAQLHKLKNGTATLATMLSDPNSEYYGGVLKLKDGIERLNTGAVKLNEGAGKLADGTTKLADGTQQLHDGSLKLKDGTSQLAGKLGEGASTAPSAKNVEASAKQVSVPIVYKENNSNPVQTVVDSHDPTVKSLSGGASMLIVMVFGFLLMAMAAILIPHVFGTDRRSAFVGPTLKSFAGLAGIGVITLAVLAAGASLVGWKPASAAGIALGFLLTATAAAATNQMLRALLGRFTGGIAILAAFAFGMFSFGGVWPLATVPSFFQVFHPITPMTYARNAFVQASQGELNGSYVVAVLVLLAFTLIPLAITLVVRAARVKKLREEHGNDSSAETQEPALV
ncbi:ABC transporter permease [Corynebacterium ulcerans]|uniref:YhgE/Pip family protein n=1 Tax=Corynebacterium ulcerans TaxID=65058 RepID=UPI00052115AE|nr:YhgE/Pip family protein [Corynebacterium ulcerans]AIU31533.1 ABC-2 type transporter family protein [Corynebacterium ulcerans]AIU92798.1 ABC-2 type transporter family protein [Corynebacterium ulcerans]KPH74016.1 ABC transporter [Corynebacterium ulcerans]MBL4944607.1 YhgE/Pip family protein [Corynebacterium ulcerans]NON16551.1 ABC transporter permease [Corynebacterium ulcerans]